MNYKALFNNRTLRFKILKALEFLPDKFMISLQYYIKLGRMCNFKNPKRWTEKIQVYKMYYRSPIIGRCVDKYEVREYVSNKGLSGILVKLYCVCNSVSDVKWAQLPNSFVIKTTNGGGGINVMLIRDKSVLNIPEVVKRIKEWENRFKSETVSPGREWAYTQIAKNRIIIEELLEDKVNPGKCVDDFKILCFNGEPQYIIVDKDRFSDHKRNFYDKEWRHIDVTTDHEQFFTPYSKPKNLEEMLRVARILSSDFPFVRVDLYNIEGTIFFGELTFYPWAGYVKFKPDEFDYKLGEMMDVSNLTSIKID